MAKHSSGGDFSGLHKRQLFHWLGADIDKKLRRKEWSVAEARERYLEYLRDDFEHGLVVKRPKEAETLGRGRSAVSLDLALACFTEWSLSESRPHSTRYGRMALGFSKPWVINRGGQPVTYYRPAGRSVFLKAVLALHRFLVETRQAGGVRSRAAAAAFEDAFYVLHFAKPLASPPAERVRRKRLKPVAVRPQGVEAGAPARVRPATRYYGPVLNYLEEREWRIVRHDGSYFEPDPGKRFDSRLPFALGRELFTVVLPDHEMVKLVWQDRWLRRQLLGAAVPVTLISFQDLGTF